MPSTTRAEPKMMAMVARVTVIPIDPMISSGLRPNLSMVPMAIRVVKMLITALITVMVKAWLSSKPTASHSTLE